jgi:hypothetical protein
MHVTAAQPAYRAVFRLIYAASLSHHSFDDYTFAVTPQFPPALTASYLAAPLHQPPHQI